MAINESQISAVVSSLLDTTSDKDEKVRSATISSLKKVAKFHFAEVIKATINYRRKHSRLNIQEIRSFINLIKDICGENLLNIDENLVSVIIDYALEESLKQNDLPFVSADILITLGAKYYVQVYEKVLKYMKEDVTPPGSIIYIIGHLSLVDIPTFLPYSKSCFDYFLSVLSSIKNDTLRKLYAIAVAQLAEAVIEGLSTDKSSIGKEDYSSTVEEIFQTFANVWSLTKDNKVCEAVVQSMSVLVLLFSSEKLRDDTSQILNVFLNLYKRPAVLPRYVITQGISNLLSIVPRAALQPLLDNLLHTLHGMVWITPDFNQPLTVKNHSEVLRCYDYIGVSFEDKLCEVILRNLRSTSEQEKTVGLIVATHLLSSSEKILKPKINDLISILHHLLNEPSVKINQSLVTIIVALAYREYLMDKDTVFIEFLVKHCYHISSNKELEDLESMCSSTIYLLSSSIPVVQHLCWKVLLKVLVSGDHNQAAAVFAKSLAFLVSKCDLSSLEKNCYERSEIVFVRVISLLGSPLHQNRGIHLLNFLNHYTVWKLKVNAPIWKHKISQLVTYLEESKWNDLEWENILFDALSTSFNDDSKSWLISVNTECFKLLTERQNNAETSQNSSNDNNITIDERAMLYKMLAFFTQYVDDDSAIGNNIEKILHPIHQRSLLDLKACSRALGILSNTNLNHILKQLELLQQTLLSRKTTKFLGLIKDTKGETDVETVRRMICECYSEILIEAPPRLLLPKLKQLGLWFINQIQTSKDSQTKTACMEALLNVSEILLKYENTYDDVEDCRKTILTFAVSLIDVEKNSPNVIVLKIFITLFKLSFKIPANEKLQILQKCLNKLFHYYCILASTTPVSNESKQFDEDLTILQLCLLIKETVSADSSNADDIIMFLQPWLSHRIINLRMLSMYLLKAALNYYLECYLENDEYSIKFNQIGSLVGRICIRTFEDDRELRRLAYECIVLLLAILDCTKNEDVKIEDIQLELSNVDSFSIQNSLILAHQKFSPAHLSQLIDNLIIGFSDTNDSCSIGTARLLTSLFTEIGSELNRQALDIFSNTLLYFPKITNEDLLASSCKAILSLAKHYTETFVNTIIKQNIPLNPNVNKLWHVLSENGPFADDVLEMLLKVIQSEPMWSEEVAANKTRKLNSRPLVAIYSMKAILTCTIATQFVETHFAEVFSTMFLSVPKYMGEYFYGNDSANKASKDSAVQVLPSKLIFDTLLIVLERTKCCESEENIRSISERIEFKKIKNNPAYFELIKSLTRLVCNCNGQYIAKILTCIGSHSSDNNDEIVRSTVAVFYAETLNTECKHDIELVETVVNALLNSLNDASPMIRENSLEGLASLSVLDSRVVEQHKEKVLTALMQGLDDTQASIQHGIISQSLIGLSKLLSSLKNDYPDDIFISIAIGMKPFFEKENSQIRGLSLRLFGELAEYVSERIEEQSSFSEQVHSNLICLLLHLAEKENQVSEACKYSLRKTSKFLKSKELISVVDEYLAEDTFNYNEFVDKFIKVLGQEFPERCCDFLMTAMSYSKSNWPEIRAVAATFIGTMYSSQVENVQEKLPLDFVSVKLLILLKDNDALVRTNAVLSLGLVVEATYLMSSNNV